MSWEIITCVACKQSFKKFNVPETEIVIWICAPCCRDWRVRPLVIAKRPHPTSEARFAFEEGSGDEDPDRYPDEALIDDLASK